MADILYGGQSSYTSHGNIGSFSDTNSPGSSGSTLDTGDLRRKFNFGDRVSELALSQDPFFRFVSMVSKKPTDDPQFKFTEKRGSYHKRYAYPIGVSNDNSTWVEDNSSSLATQLDTYETAGSTVYVRMATDYMAAGNVQNVYGQSGGEITIGADGTTPGFFLEGQLVKINFSTTSGGRALTYSIVKVDNVATQVGSSSYNSESTADAVTLTCTVVKAKDASVGGTDTNFLAGHSSSALAGDSVYSTGQAGSGSTAGLEDMKAYVVGSSFDKGTGYPETWKDQPYSTGYGQTQIWKTSMAMDNTDRATVLRYASNEWARIWKEKLIEHKWDIEQSLLFGSQSDAYRTTQGAVDWILNNGNIFSMDIATKTQDDFLDDMSNLLDPRYNNSQATVFFCSTDVYNWLHKLSGYFNNNLSVGSNFRSDMTATNKKSVMGLGVTTISTVYGDMNVVRNCHLDGTNIKILGVNMKYCSYRPLVGNGINRDTSVYVGVQTLENSGVDRRVDQILTEAGMEFSMPECHAIWKV
jgi:hypothetical protein